MSWFTKQTPISRRNRALPLVRPHLELLEDRCQPSGGLLIEDFTDDVNPAAPGFASSVFQHQPVPGMFISSDFLSNSPPHSWETFSIAPHVVTFALNPGESIDQASVAVNTIFGGGRVIFIGTTGAVVYSSPNAPPLPSLTVPILDVFSLPSGTRGFVVVDHDGPSATSPLAPGPITEIWLTGGETIFDDITIQVVAANVVAADLAVTLAAAPEPVRQGDLLTYTIDVANLGPAAAAEVTLRQQLPDDFLVEDTSTPVAQSGDVLTFQLGSLAVGVHRIVTVSGRPGRFGTIATTASIAAAETDPGTANNTAVLETQVESAFADLAVSMSAWSGAVLAGEVPVSYTTIVTNQGPSRATGVILEQTLPTKIDFVSAPGGVQPVNGVLTFDLGEVAPGESREFQVTVIPRTNGTFVSSASVTALQLDLLIRDNAASASGQATGGGLRPEVSASALTVPIGEPVTITFVLVNRDESDATAASMDIRLNVVDYLNPIYLDAAETSQGTLTLTTAAVGQYLLDAGPIASGDVVVVTFRLRGYDLFTLEPLYAYAHDPVLTGPSGMGSNNLSITFVPNPADIDSDMVPGAVEDGAPNNGDGNDDGILDSQQNHITSLPNAADGRYVTLVTAGDTPDPSFDIHLLGVEAIPVPPNPPAGAAFPVGFFRFQIYTENGDGVGTVYIYIPADVFPTSYYKYGPTPEDPTPHWYGAWPLWGDIYPMVQLPHPGQPPEFHRIELFLGDGQRGDSDLVRNERVTDPGGPAVGTFMPPPTAQRIAINDGHAQRSMINSLTVTFSGVVTLDPGAFELRNAAGRAVGLILSSSIVNGRTVVMLTFRGRDILGGSLADGTYRLLLHSDRIHDQFGQALDGDHDDAAGGDATTEFFRRFGDTDGDGDVDKDDGRVFKEAWRSRLGEADYRWYLDHDLDGDIDKRDKKRFRVAYQAYRCRR